MGLFSFKDLAYDAICFYPTNMPSDLSDMYAHPG